jgi:hypothetical protein
MTKRTVRFRAGFIASIISDPLSKSETFGPQPSLSRMTMKTRFGKVSRSGTRAKPDDERPRSPKPPAERGAGAGEGQPLRTADPETQRIREAGGPIDRAFYSCGCGYVFVAEVSTTVKCPYCKAGQAW